ncbi:MAG: hypothetical protein VBE63_01685 [Lamprobacter sp.]|uniref:hypothetical protein n=1 Tax=Lamprobacter sp. TaxID=3100796 RepID=UPI002B25B4EE|nr:hypothetical protein [Lamprobacter sp.]MEA3638638.1 hypothetical protein [Lamprobacter sp.]
MPYIIVSTPRAGRWNHRLLVAKTDPCEGMDRHWLVSAARKQSEGRAWLSVTRPVQQMNSARTGDEILILGDIDTASLTSEQKHQLLAQLRNFLEDDLDRLITTKIDWEREGKSDPVMRAELGQWINQLESMGIQESQDEHWNPVLARNMRAEQAAKEKKNAKTKKLKKFFMEPTGIASSLVVVVIISGLACFQLGCFSSLETKMVVDGPKAICLELKANDSCQLSKEEYENLCALYSFNLNDCSERLGKLEPKDTENLDDIFGSFKKDGRSERFLLATLKLGENMKKEMGIDESKGAVYITPEEFRSIRDYKGRISVAVTEVKKNSDSVPDPVPEISRNVQNFDPKKPNYDTALKELQKYLEELSKETKSMEQKRSGSVAKQLEEFLDSCSHRNKTINDRIKSGCDFNTKGWDLIQNEYKNFAPRYDAIIKLKFHEES